MRRLFTFGLFLLIAAMVSPALADQAHNPMASPPATTQTPTGGVGESVPVLKIQGRRSISSASDQVVRQQDFEYLPRNTPSDVVRVVPGLQVSQHTGGAKAYQYSLRGFDAEHGQDLAVYFDGIPLNEASHVHGHGYLDLHFLIPEVLERIEVLKGPYDPLYGNFAVAGTINLVPCSAAERGDKHQAKLGVSAGSFNFGRAFIAGAYSGQRQQYCAAADLESTAGYTDPGQAQAYRAFAKYRAQPQSRLTVDLLVTAYDQRSAVADVVPERNVLAGASRYRGLDPSAAVNSSRYLLGNRWRWQQGVHNMEGLVYGQFKTTAIYSNTTYFLYDPTNGDQRGQYDRRWFGGATLNDRWSLMLGKVAWTGVSGIEYKLDNVQQSLAATTSRQILDRLTNVGFKEQAFAWYWRNDLDLTAWLRLVGGTRIDAIAYQGDGQVDVEIFDVTSNTQLTLQDQSITWRDAAWAVSPKASMIFQPLVDWNLFLNYGEGFFSNPSLRQAVAGSSQIPKARGAELGTRGFLLNHKLTLAGAAWWAHKQSDVLFDGESGLAVPIGATERFGVDGELRCHVWEWLYAGLDVTYTLSRFVNGHAPLPNIPKWTQTHLLAVQHRLNARALPDSATENSLLHAAIRGRHVGRRQLALGFYDRPYYVVDAELGVENNNWEASLAAVNVFNQTWRDGVFAYTSRPSASEPAYTGLHFTPGTPLSLKLTLTAKF